MSNLSWSSNYKEVMRLDGSGNLNIGTSPLHSKETIFSVGQEGEINLNDSLGEMLKISNEGFYVRGVKVEQDADEAQRVYEAFRSWLVWATLTRDSDSY